MLRITIGGWLVVGCTSAAPVTTPVVDGAPTTASDGNVTDSAPTGGTVTAKGARADVTGVTVTGDPGAYTFAVTVRSDDTGCERYADWWEVVTVDGALVYRRILTHSHVDEQPFTRSGGPVDVTADTEVVVRGHLSPGGFVGDVSRGTVAGGFVTEAAADGFGAGLEKLPPQPDGCLF